MNTDLLCAWLDLKPGSWPPTPHELLGPGPDTQERAMRLMEKLRPHQLRHPELVTEGMNRLAQALVALESGKPQDVVAGAPPGTDVVGSPQHQVVLDAEVLESRRPRRHRPKRRSPPTPPPAPEIVTPPALREPGRRANYRRLVCLRRALQAWTELGGALGVSRNRLDNSIEMVRFLQASSEFQNAAREVRDTLPEFSSACTLIFHPASLAILRDMQPRQRRALAIDWARVHAHWQIAVQGQRLALRASKPSATLQQRLRAAYRGVAGRPEIVLVGVLGGTLLIAVARSIRF